MLEHGPEQPFPYALPVPKWQFLCHIADQHDIALHGSNNPNLTELTPRHASDMHEFGAQNAVYAAGDGIWPMYFAIVDRSRVPTLVNACIKISFADGREDGPFYLFSIGRQAKPHFPYLAGMIYLLPATTFVAEPAMPFGDFHVRAARLASATAVMPLAKMTVQPEDFPFLTRMLSPMTMTGSLNIHRPSSRGRHGRQTSHLSTCAERLRRPTILRVNMPQGILTGVLCGESDMRKNLISIALLASLFLAACGTTPRNAGADHGPRCH